jgi:protein-disulfide isomerase
MTELIPNPLMSRVVTLVLWLAPLAGSALSVAALLKICGACSETARYRVGGLSFGWVGLGFFLVLTLLQLFKRRNTRCGELLGLSWFAAAGAELHFLWIQKFEIGQWCPLCLGIAATVALACVATLVESFAMKGTAMTSVTRKLMVALLFVLLGLGGSLLLTGQEAQAEQPDLYLGKSASHTTVYFVSDWFCPVCRKMEPDFERLIPVLARSVRLGFVDYPLHKETLNFTPYNLQFLAYEKEKYPALRKALGELALKTKKPTDAEVRAAVAPLGVALRVINYADAFAGMQANLALYRDFKIKATPTVVVTNSKTGKTKQLVGERQISEASIKSAIAEVEK